MDMVGSVVLYGLAIASLWALIAVCCRFNLKGQFFFWLCRIVPLSTIIAGALYKLGVFRWLEAALWSS